MVKIKHKSALGRLHSEYLIFPDRAYRRDVEKCIQQLFGPAKLLLLRVLQRLGAGYAFKFHVQMLIGLEKFSFEVGDFVYVEQWFRSRCQLVLTADTIAGQLGLAFDQIGSHLDTFVHGGSGWVVKGVEKMGISVYRFRLFSGGCLRSGLPSRLRSMRAILCSSQNRFSDNKCFLRSVAMGLMPAAIRNRSRNVKLSERIMKLLPQNCLPSQGPVTLRDVARFEKKAPVSVNIFGFVEGSVVPCHISKLLDKKDFHVDLLLHQDHFYTISNLAALVRGTSRGNRRASYVCQFCLSFFTHRSRYDLHTSLCSGKAQAIQMPPSDCVMKFKNFNNLVPAPFVIYADLESSINTPEKLQCKGKRISRRKHDCISWACVTVCRDNPAFSSSDPVIYTGSDCLRQFFVYLCQEYARIKTVLDTTNHEMVFTAEDRTKYHATAACPICSLPFDHPASYPKVRDHCHLSGRFRGALCSRCNLTFASHRRKEKVVVLFHGLGNYDSHFLVQQLHAFDDANLKVIPRTSEKYLSFSIAGDVLNVIFKDSYQFLNDSLSNLVQNLRTKGVRNFEQVCRFFPQEEQRNLLFRKGVFPYNYITSIGVLEERSLPPKEEFYNDLTRKHISEPDYNFAQQVWSAFGCQSLKDYLQIYLIADVLLLADCFESFRSNCIADYELDPAFYFSNAHFTFDAFLRHSRAQIQLLSDVNMHMFVSNGIRGGLSMVSGKRFSRANNRQLPNSFDPADLSRYIIDLDCNNLYGLCMMQHLPFAEFQWCEPSDHLLREILQIPPDSDFGYILECDLGYPAHLHDGHQDYPLAPCRKSVSYEDLSPFAKSLCDKHGLKASANTPKLMATLEDKTNYILHYRNLQLYSSLGLEIQKVHRVLKFRQAPLMKGYIQFNSAKRAQSRNSFDVNYYKLLSNSLFGKTMERPDNKTLIKLVNCAKTYEKYVARLTFKNSKIITDKLIGLQLNYPVLKIEKPTFLGFAILDLAKFFMYDFHYNVMKKHFGPRLELMYTDTDSLIYDIASDDLYEELALLPGPMFDFSNYPENHPLFSSENKRVPGAFKDECQGNAIEAFVGLRSKMYCIKHGQEGAGVLKVAKGVKRNVIENDLRYENYYECLKNDARFEHDFHVIRSRAHHVETSHESKASLSAFDDKRFLLDAFQSLPYGHYAL